MQVTLSGGALGGTVVEWVADDSADGLEIMTMPSGNKYRLVKIGATQAVLHWLAPGNEE